MAYGEEGLVCEFRRWVIFCDTLSSMNVAKLAELLDVHPDTVRRWAGKDYKQFMSPTATPQRGKTRVFTTTDAAVLSYIATMRTEGKPADEIHQRLVEMQSERWIDLPEVPTYWFSDSYEETMTVELAAVRASQVAQIAVLQTELEHTRLELQAAQDQLVEARSRVTNLEIELEALRASSETITRELQEQIHTREVELERAKQDVARFEGQLQQYSLGREKPINVGLIILVTAFVVAVLVIILLVVVRLVL